MSYIYLVTNKLNGKQYVGQHRYNGVGLDPKYKGSGHALLDAYNSVGQENFKMELIEECDDELLNEREIYWISVYDCVAPNGYNLTYGGEQYKMSEETKRKIGNANKAKLDTRLKVAQYTLEGKFIKCYDSVRIASEQTGITENVIRSNIYGSTKQSSSGYIWKYYENDNDLYDFSPYKRKKRTDYTATSKKINQYDDNGNLIKTYPSASEAARQFGCTCGAILFSCKNHINKSNDFRFRYADECGDKIEPYISPKKYNQKQINQYSLDGTYIKTWDSLSSIHCELGFDIASICECCKMRRKVSHDFQWRYTSECNGYDNIEAFEVKTLPSGYWNDYDHCKIAISECTSVGDAKKKYGGALKSIYKNGWEDLLTPLNKRLRYGFWNYDECKKAAAMCKNRSEFHKKHSAGFKLSYKNGWLDEFFPQTKKAA